MARSNKTIEQKYNTPFAANIRKLMDERAITQDVLAKAIGKTRQTVSQYANGISEPSYETLIKIANFFNVSIDYLLGVSPYSTADIDLKYVCQYTGLSEKSIKYLKMLSDIQSKKAIGPWAAEKIEYGKKRKEFWTSNAGIVKIKNDPKYTTPGGLIDQYAAEFGINDKNDLQLIIQKYEESYYDSWVRLVISEDANRSTFPLTALNAIIESDQENSILTQLSVFMQVDFEEKNSKMTLEASKNGKRVFVKSSKEDIVWGMMRKIEQSLCDLRDKFSEKFSLNLIESDLKW